MVDLPYEAEPTSVQRERLTLEQKLEILDECEVQDVGGGTVSLLEISE